MDNSLAAKSLYEQVLFHFFFVQIKKKKKNQI